MSRYFFSLTLIFSAAIALGQGIVYTSQSNNNDNIFVIDEGGYQQQLTSHRSKDSSPVISFDVKFMVFTSERVGWWKIWLMNLETKEVKQLTHSGAAEYNPSWSLDSRQIIFVSERNGNDEIYIMDNEGKKVDNLTNNGGSDNTPSWGADNKIYYSSKINDVYQIMRMNPDGSSKERLTSSSGDKLMPQLSPDEKELLFYGNVDGNFEIYTFNLQDNNLQRLTNHQLFDMRARWSPDGSKIVFERGDKRKNHQIFIMNSDGTGVKQLTRQGYNYAPSFVPVKIKLLDD